MKYRLLGRLAFGVPVICFAVSVKAQSCTTVAAIPSSCTVAAPTFQFTARNTIQVSVSPTSFDFGNPTAADFNQGFTQALGHAVTVQSNNTWTLTIRTSAALWTGTGGGRANKPRTDLQWATVAGGPYTAMPGTSAGTALTVATGTATGSQVVNIYYRVLWSWTLDIPCTYTIPVVLLLSAP